MKKALLVLIIIVATLNLLLPTTLNAQEKEIVSNVRVQQSDTLLIITYDLTVKAEIKVYVSFDGGKTYKGPLKYVSGEVGKGIAPRKNKVIIWDVVSEVGYVDEDNVVIDVEAIEEIEIIEAPKIVEETPPPTKEKSLNGHYFSVGSSILADGYYGFIGLSYEYRYKILGINFSAGYGWYGLSANVGAKLYLANKIKVLRNIYVNIIPFSYLGQDYKGVYILDNNNIIKKYPHIFSSGLFLGYSPVWFVNNKNKVALGFNMDIGTRVLYRKNDRVTFPWDLGFVVKF